MARCPQFRGEPFALRSGNLLNLQRLVAALVTWSCLSGVPSALAAPASKEREAGTHFDRGVELYQEGSLDAALVEFERAYELVPNFRLLFNLGQIQAERHDYTAALSLFEKYLNDGGDAIPESRRAETKREIERLRTRVAYLWVESNSTGATLSVNGVARGTLPLSERIAINPGLCDLRLEKAGFVTAQEHLKVAGGELPRVQMPLTPILQSEAIAPSDATGTLNYRPFWATSLTAVALGGATLGLGLAARNAHRRLDAELNRFPGNREAIDDARSMLKRYSALSAATGAIGLVALGVAVYFLIAPPKTRERERQLAQGRLRILPGLHSLALQAEF